MKRFLVLLLLVGSVFCSGCAAALLGGGLIGGIIISDDSVQNVFSAPLERVWQSCIDYLKNNGEIVKIDKDNGIIYAERVFGKKYVQIQVTGKPSGTHVMIKARKTVKLLPDVDTAVKIMTDLIRELE